MTEKTRNVIVGITVLGALCVLGAMILMFTGLPAMFQRGYIVRMESNTKHDIHEGDPVHISGIRVGRIAEIGFKDPKDPGKGVAFTARIDEEVSIPGNARIYVFTKGFVGASYLEIKADGPDRIDPDTGKPMEFLPKDRPVTLEMVHVGSGLLPAELTPALAALKDLAEGAKPAMESLAKLAENLNAMITPPPAPSTTPSATTTTNGAPTTEAAPSAPVSLYETVAKFNRALDAMYAVLGDMENQANIKASFANLNKATAGAVETMAALKAFAGEASETMKGFRETSATAARRIDELTGKLIEDAEKISTLMATINRAATKIDSGQGTFGRLVNDPALYDSFVEATRQMGDLMKEFRSLVETWKTHGVKVDLK